MVTVPAEITGNLSTEKEDKVTSFFFLNFFLSLFCMLNHALSLFSEKHPVVRPFSIYLFPPHSFLLD